MPSIKRNFTELSIKELSAKFHEGIKSFIGKPITPITISEVAVYTVSYLRKLPFIEADEVKFEVVKTEGGFNIIPKNLYTYVAMQTGIAIISLEELPEFGEWVAPNGVAYILKYNQEGKTTQEKYITSVRYPPFNLINLLIKILCH